jgi:hypothetical protein
MQTEKEEGRKEGRKEGGREERIVYQLLVVLRLLDGIGCLLLLLLVQQELCLISSLLLLLLHTATAHTTHATLKCQ